MKKIGVFGLWHLGCVLTAAWSKLGNQVIGFDYDIENIENLQKGIPPLFEPFLETSILPSDKLKEANRYCCNRSLKSEKKESMWIKNFEL